MDLDVLKSDKIIELHKIQDQNFIFFSIYCSLHII